MIKNTISTSTIYIETSENTNIPMLIDKTYLSMISKLFILLPKTIELCQ